MSTKNIGTANHAGPRVLRQPAVLAYCYALQSPFDLNGSLCRSLAEINAIWVSLANHRLQEYFSLPRELAGCTSLPAMLSVYGEYYQTAIRQYQTGLSVFQQIALKLLTEVPLAGFVPAKTADPSQECTVPSSQPATDEAR